MCGFFYVYICMMKVVCAACLLLLLTACGTRNKAVSAGQPKARIFERKTLPGNKLLVSYSWQKGKVVVNDSAVVDNKIIGQDSVPVNLLAKSRYGNARTP